MIQLTRSGIRKTGDLEALREDFARHHVIRLPALLSDDILTRIHTRMQTETWEELNHGGIGRELVLRDRSTLQMLKFLMNAPGFLAIMREVTGCEAMTRFDGRIYRMVVGRDHYDSWHNDIVPSECRLIGLSINLSPQPYSGGVFHLRDSASAELLRVMPNIIAGDAIVFRISDDLEHVVSPVEGPEPKTAFAGWFGSTGGDFFASVKQHETEQLSFRQPDSCD
jgi:hypothetical protein